jgi:hypothetical protein
MESTYIQTEEQSKLQEECGVFGVCDFGGEDLASPAYYGLLALQRRGKQVHMRMGSPPLKPPREDIRGGCGENEIL